MELRNKYFEVNEADRHILDIGYVSLTEQRRENESLPEPVHPSLCYIEVTEETLERTRATIHAALSELITPVHDPRKEERGHLERQTLSTYAVEMLGRLTPLIGRF